MRLSRLPSHLLQALHPFRAPCPVPTPPTFQLSPVVPFPIPGVSRGLFDNIHFGPQFLLQRLLSCLRNLCMSALPWSDQEVPEDRQPPVLACHIVRDSVLGIRH